MLGGERVGWRLRETWREGQEEREEEGIEFLGWREREEKKDGIWRKRSGEERVGGRP